MMVLPSHLIRLFRKPSDEDYKTSLAIFGCKSRTKKRGMQVIYKNKHTFVT